MLVVVVGWSLLAGLVGPVPVLMVGVRAEDRSKVPFVVDQHPVGALGSCGSSAGRRDTGERGVRHLCRAVRKHQDGDVCHRQCPASALAGWYLRVDARNGGLGQGERTVEES